MADLKNLDLYSRFEEFLGNSESSTELFGFETLLKLDNEEVYPTEQLAALNDWGLNHYLVPNEYGGELRNLEDLFFLWRLLARRDLTCAVAYGGSFLGVVSIWIAGSDTLKIRVAKDLKAGKKVAFAMTEKDSGSDLMSVKVSAEYNADTDRFLLSGEKWLYNHASKANYTTVLSKTSKDAGPRSCSLIYTPTLGETGGQTQALTSSKRIHTVGLKGLDVGGVTFDKHVVEGGNLIGKVGSGFELALTGLQVTKTMCGGLALGSLDTIFRSTVKFCLSRVLYKDSIVKIPIVKAKLCNTFLDIILAECVCLTASRAAQLIPNQFSLLSAIVKALVPTLVESNSKELSSLLGARSYINSETEYRIFQKQARDNTIIPIFEGNTYVNYQYVIQQMEIIFSLESSIRNPSALDLTVIYDLSKDIPSLDFTKLAVMGKGRDDLALSLSHLVEKLQKHTDLEQIIKEIEFLYSEFEVIKRWFLNEKPNVNNPYVIKAKVFYYANRYAILHAISAVANIIYYNKEMLHQSFDWRALLYCCLKKVSSSLKGEFFELGEAEESTLMDYIESLTKGAQLYSLFPLKVR